MWSTDKKKQKVVIIIGMHRSGTSATAGVISTLGIDFGSNLLEPREQNPKGFFEKKDFTKINNMILSQFSCNWHNLDKLPQKWELNKKVNKLKEEIKNIITTQFHNSKIFGLKDPRISILLPVYIDAFHELGLDVKIVRVRRSKFDSARSLEVSNKMPPLKALTLIEEYNHYIDKNLKKLPHLEVNYDLLLENTFEQVEMIADHLGIVDKEKIKNASNFIDKNLRHENYSAEEYIEHLKSRIKLLIPDNDLEKKFDDKKYTVDKHIKHLAGKIDKVLPKYNNHTPKKVAILFWGITRSLNYTIDSIEKNIFNVLNESGISFDKYLHTYNFEGTLTNSRSNEFNLKLNFEEYKLIKPDYYVLDNQDKVKERLNLKEYKTLPSVWEMTNPEHSNTVDNFIVAMYSKKRVTELMESSGQKYDYCLFIRPDVLYVNKFEINFLNQIKDGFVSVPDFHKYSSQFGQMNDRMALTTYSDGLKYGKVFDYLLEYSKEYNLHSEEFISYCLRKKYNLHINFIPFYFKRMRADGNIAERDKLILNMQIGVLNKIKSLILFREHKKVAKYFKIWIKIIFLEENFLHTLKFLINILGREISLKKILKKNSSVGKLPDFVIIGTQKSGTSSLNYHLGEHPMIEMYSNKNNIKGLAEVHFFNKEMNWRKGVKWYKSLFNNNDLLQGKKTPCYIFITKSHERMYKTIPKAKLILLLRNPVDRCYSHYNMDIQLQRKFKHEEFAKFLNTQVMDDKLINDLKMSNIIARGFYINQIRHLLKYYKREQLLILISEDMKEHPQKTYDQIFTFLGIEKQTIEYSPNIHQRNYSVMQNIHRNKLAEIYRPYNEELFKFLGYRVNTWD